MIRPLGTPLAVPALHVTNAGRDCWMLRDPTFAGLDRIERQALLDWLAAARARGIDAAVDFARRPWDAGELEGVIGIFETARPIASWLVVRYQSQWVVVTVTDETISAVRDSLQEALELIRVPGAL